MGYYYGRERLNCVQNKEISNIGGKILNLYFSSDLLEFIVKVLLVIFEQFSSTIYGLQVKCTPYFKDLIVPTISFTYNTSIPIATKIFNYKNELQDLNIDNFKT